MIKLLAMAGLVAVCGLLGCGGGDNKTSYDYQFTENGCDTGDQTFTDLAGMCAGLQSKSLNHSCALAARQTFFASHCTGTFAETP